MGIIILDNLVGPQSTRATDPGYPLLTDDDAVDLAVLMGFEEKHVDGQPDLVVDLIDLFIDEAPHKLTVMRNALELEDSQALSAAAHSLKGSSSSLGAYVLASRCNDLESIAGNLSNAEINESLVKAENEFERVRVVFMTERFRRTTNALIPDVGRREF